MILCLLFGQRKDGLSTGHRIESCMEWFFAVVFLGTFFTGSIGIFLVFINEKIRILDPYFELFVIKNDFNEVNNLWCCLLENFAKMHKFKMVYDNFGLGAKKFLSLF